MGLTEIVKHVFLGVLQGLTEFIPVSSSGHLVIAEKLINNFNPPGVFFETVLHMGTLLAVVVYFRRELLKLDRKMIIFLGVGSIPAFAIGYFGSDVIEGIFSNVRLVGFALLITALMNMTSDKFKGGSEKLSIQKVVNIGLFQAFAIIPGISRSGSTIFGGVTQKIDKPASATFSFLLSIPAIVAASGYQFVKYGFELTNDLVAPYFLGFLAAFIVGFYSIRFVYATLVSKHFKYFGYYCLVLGILAIVIS